MRCENHYSFQVILFLLLVLILNSAALTFSSSCPSYCGRIEIPYSFGVGKGCYLDKGYEIKCNNVSGKSAPFLSVNNKEVVNIFLPIQYSDRSMSYASLRIKIPITPSNEQEFSLLLNSTRLGNPKWFHAKQYATIEFERSFRTMNPSFITSLGCQNRLQYTGRSGNISCTCESRNNSGIIYASCGCTEGYKGNPYVLSGCKRVKEFHDDYCIDSSESVRTLLIMLLSVGVSVGVALVSSVILYIVIRRRRQTTRKKKFFKRNGGLMLQQQLTSTQDRVENTKVFSSNELEKATENFSEHRVLGQGGQGTVFKGMLIDGRIVAVKKTKAVDEDKLEEFINEVFILSQINHRNIVKLLGCCLETEVPLLVYEFVSNGNLFEHLHDEFSDYTVAIWGVRLRIAIEIAGALSYLHSAASAPVYHRDIKSTNIMLDENYRAKVSDFGTSRSVTEDHTHLTTLVSGTAGYLDPEYFQSSQFTDKSDVYSFGVVLVELITGEKSISFIRSLENRTLANYFNLSMKENKVADIIDTRIRDDCKVEQVMAVAQVAGRCLNPERNKRPNMRKVSMELERIRSSPQEMQAHVYVSDNAKAKEAVEVNNTSVESKNIVSVTAPVSQYNIASSSSTWSDVEPLFPLQTQ